MLFNGVFWADWYFSCPVFLCVSLCLQMVSGLFLKHSESLSQQRSNMRRSSTARRYQANTVSAKFQTSLQELLDKMERFGRNTDWSPACMGWLLLSFQLIFSSTLQINWNCGLNCCCGHEPLSYIKWIYWWLIMAHTVICVSGLITLWDTAESIAHIWYGGPGMTEWKTCLLQTTVSKHRLHFSVPVH